MTNAGAADTCTFVDRALLAEAVDFDSTADALAPLRAAMTSSIASDAAAVSPRETSEFATKVTPPAPAQLPADSPIDGLLSGSSTAANGKSVRVLGQVVLHFRELDLHILATRYASRLIEKKYPIKLSLKAETAVVQNFLPMDSIGVQGGTR